MNKEFNFDEIEKRMPYTAPESFFDEAYENTLKLVHRRKKINLFVRISATVIAAAAVIVVGLFIINTEQKQDLHANNAIVQITNDSLLINSIATPAKDTSISINEVIEELSDQELEDMLISAEVDELYAELK